MASGPSCGPVHKHDAASRGERYDLAVVGAGIVGLAHALAAARAGLKVVVIERDLRANRASIRNFGFITVTGQPRGEVWRLARRTRDVWAEIAPAAGIAVEHDGLALTLRRPESVAVAEAFLATEMGEGCELLEAPALRARFPEIAAGDALGALVSPHELRVDSPQTLPRLAEFLAREHGVTFRTGVAALAVAPPEIATSRGPAMTAPILPRAAAQGYAPEVVVCAGETRSGRPSPLMLWQALIALDAWPARLCVKVDDAEVGIAEGRAAGCWSVGVAASGNGVGLSLAAFEALPAAGRRARVARTAQALAAAGAHLVIDTVAELPAALAEIERRIAAGLTP